MLSTGKSDALPPVSISHEVGYTNFTAYVMCRCVRQSGG